MARVVFFGSPDFALPSLNALIGSPFSPELVVTQPDRPAGRGREVTPTPVRRLAEEKGIDTLVVGNFRESDAADRILALKPDFFVVVAFGLIFPLSVLKIVTRASVNLHASLLPAYRGASPINHAIVNGELFTGVSTMEMVKTLDAGPVYLQRVFAIDPLENAGELSQRLAGQGGALLVETLRGIEEGALHPVQQPEEGVSFAPRLAKSDGEIPWQRNAIGVHNHIRGMNPWPGSFTHYEGGYLKVHGAVPWDLVPRGLEPGRIIRADGEGIVVACGAGSIRITRVQIEGKRPLDAGEFLRGFPLKEGAVLGGAE